MIAHIFFRNLNLENGIIIWYCIKPNITKINPAFTGYIFQWFVVFLALFSHNLNFTLLQLNTYCKKLDKGITIAKLHYAKKYKMYVIFWQSQL